MPENWLENWSYWATLGAFALALIWHGVQHRRERHADAASIAAWKTDVVNRIEALEEKSEKTREKLGEIFHTLEKINTRLSRIEGALNHKSRQ